MRAAVLIDAEFQDAEVIYPYYRLQEAGFEVDLLGRDAGLDVVGKWGYHFRTDVAVKDADASQYAVVVIPGGNAPDKMRTQDAFVAFARTAMQHCVVAAICHGPELLIDADAVQGRQVTSYVAIRRDLENAGATWSDAAAVIDGNLITSRKPADLPDFMDATLSVLEPREVPA